MIAILLVAALGWAGEIYNPLDPTWKPPPAGFNGGVNLDVDIDQGNVDQTKLTGSAAMMWVMPDEEVRLVLRGKHQLASGTRVAQDIFGHLRLTRQVEGPWHIVTFLQLSSQPFKSQSLRALTGTGVEWRVYPTDTLRVSLALSAMAEIDEFARDVVDEDQGLHARASAYAIVATQLSATANTGFVVFAQPRIDDFANQRGSADAFLNVDITPPPRDDDDRKIKGTLRWSLQLDWDSKPPEGVEPLDVGVTAGIGVSWS